MKRIFSVLFVFIILLNSVNALALTKKEAQGDLWKTYHKGLENEKNDNFSGALKEYNRFLECAEYLQENDGQIHWENIKSIRALVNHLSLAPQLYAETKDCNSAKYFGEKHEPRYGAFFGKCNNFEEDEESAFCVYVSFGRESIEGFEWLIPEVDDIYLQIAWNAPTETKADLDAVNSGKMDDYIISNLKYVNRLNKKVLIRFFAEVNCWNLPSDPVQLAEFIESYKLAFRRVANYAHRYAPNAAMVYSPHDISNWYVTVEDFYPGDEYVDWVGTSMYSNRNSSAHFERADMYDAYYCLGYYDNPIIKIKNVVDAFGDRKPILVSGCGFAHANGEDTQDDRHAIRQLEFFYSYLTMVYPQIKGVLLFNANYGGTEFSIDTSPALKKAFYETTRANVSFDALKNGGKLGYTKFTDFNESTDELKLYMYADFPTEYTSSVAYSLDGRGIPHDELPPYEAIVDVSKLALGKHTLKIAVSNGKYYKTKDYVFYVGAGNYITQSEQDAKNHTANNVIKVTINGEPVSFKQNPVIDNDRTLVPLRAIFEALGAEVKWEGATQKITATKQGVTIKMQIGNNKMKVNNRTVTLDVPAKLVNDHTMVPVRAVSESFNCKVVWDADTKTVIITK